MIPKTSYILNGMRDLYIKQADPSILNKDPILGLKTKERKLAKFTHENLAKSIPNYEEKESRIAATLGDNYSKILCGAITKESLRKSPASISFSNFYIQSSSSSSSDGVIHAGETYFLESIISGGTYALDSYTHQWLVIKEPILGSLHVTDVSSEVYPEYWRILSEVVFDQVGFYVLQMKLSNTLYPKLSILETTGATVVA